jgi:hypothetical protein
MKYILFFSILFIAFGVTAQVCDQELLAQKPGYWKAGIKGSTYLVSAVDLKKETAILASIHKSISAKYVPIGCQASYTNYFSGTNPAAGKNWVADYFGYTIFPLRFLCDPGSNDKSKWYVNIATSSVLNIDANIIGFLNTIYSADLSDDDSRGYLKMAKRPVMKNGYYTWGEEISGDGRSTTPEITYRWLITYDENLPFKDVSRKEYLLLVKKKLEQTLIDDKDHKEFYSKYMNRINENLNQPENFLNEAAVCMWNNEERFEGFVEEGTKGSFIAIKPNLDYYNKKLGKSVPQFFLVTYRIATSVDTEVENMNRIREAVDFAELREMLGK